MKLVFVFAAFLIYSHTRAETENLIGMSVYSDLNQTYFVVAIHSEDGNVANVFDDGLRRSIEIRVVSKKLFARQFARIWVNGTAVNSNKSEFYEHTESIVEFTQCIKGNLERGDIILINYGPDAGISLHVNRVFIHTFADTSFFNLLLGVLVGDVPLSSKIKSELLAGSTAKTNQDALNLYTKLSPARNRVAVARRWANKSRREDEPPPKYRGRTAESGNRSVSSGGGTEKTAVTGSEIVDNKAARTAKPGGVTAANLSQSRTRKENSAASKGATKDHAAVRAAEKYNPFTIESLLAEREFAQVVNHWVGKFASYPVLVAERPEKESIRFTITLDKNGSLIGLRQYEKSKYAALNKGAIKLLKKSAPFPKIPQAIQDDFVDIDLYFYLHWRYLR